MRNSVFAELKTMMHINCIANKEPWLLFLLVKVTSNALTRVRAKIS
jgi:hypothetical protein